MTVATIPSRTSSQTYTVTLHDDGAASCTCKAGQHGRCCWHVKALRAEAERRRAAELAALDAEVDAMTDQIRWHGPEMPAAAFSALQRRYWAARERQAELSGIPLLTVG
jgi:hypothetical protein